MSIKVMTWVWDSGPEDKTALLVMLALADFCDDNGVCYPSMRRIAEKARLTERGAQKVVRRLESDGWISITTGNGRHGTNVYSLHKTPNEVRPPNEVHPEHGCKKPRTRVQETPNSGSPEPSRTVKEPSVSEILCAVASSEIVTDFIEHRRLMKKPLTTVAAKRMAKRLGESGAADAALSLSIENGWQGVFPEKVKAPPNRPGAGTQSHLARYLEKARKSA